MKIILAAFAMAIASPALAQTADPHANHKADAAPAAPMSGGHEGEKKGCCPDKQKDCCKDMQGKGCCADKAKAGADASANHHSH